MPSQAEIEEHQQDVQELSALAVAEVTAVVITLSDEGNDENLIDTIISVLIQFMDTATELAMDWYRGLTRATPQAGPSRVGPGVIVGPNDRLSLLDAADYDPVPAKLPSREQLEASVRWALHPPARLDFADLSELDDLPRLEDVPEPRDEPEPEHVPEQEASEPDVEDALRARVIPAEASDEQARIISRLAGATQRYVTSAARDTVTENAGAEDVRWARHAQAGACAFCRLLATRGADYLTEESASTVGASGRVRGPRQQGESYHDDCSCVPVPVRAGDSYEPPDYVNDWTAQYEHAYEEARGDYKKILPAMRRAEKANGGSTH